MTYREGAPRPACARCGGDLPDGGTFTKDGLLVCKPCAALASIAEADARAAGPVGASRAAPRREPAWLRPQVLRRHGTAVSLTLGLVGLLGAPVAIYTFFVDGPWFRLVGAGYVLLMGTALWATIVVAGERSNALAARARASVPMGPAPPAAPPMAPPPPGAGSTVAAAAGPAMIAAGCGGALLAIAVVVVALLAWFFYELFIKPGAGSWNVG